MPLHRAIKEQLAGNVPEDQAVRAMVQQFISQSGYTLRDIAEATGYSVTAVCLFLSGKYCAHHVREGNSLLLRAMLKDFVESHPLLIEEKDSGILYKTADYKVLRKAFHSALDNGWAYCIDGAPGTRKTFLLKALVRELAEQEASKNGQGRRAFFVRARINIRPHSLLQRIANAAGVPDSGRRIDQLIKKILFHFSSRRALLVLDEAQLLNVECLETVRELLDEPPYFGLIFAGSHDVQSLFVNLQMEQWRSRVQKTIVLNGLELADAEAMIEAELGKRPKKAIADLLASSYAMDVRQRGEDQQPRKYLSARNLFWAIQQIKQMERGKPGD